MNHGRFSNFPPTIDDDQLHHILFGRSWVCHLDHLHLPHRRVHVVVAGRIAPWPRRVLHQEDAPRAPHLLGFQADQRRDIARYKTIATKNFGMPS